MDITETFRSEDISKTDFFDFVVGPDVSDTQTLQQFSKQMRTVNAYLGNSDATDHKEANNNNTNNNNNNSSTNSDMLDSVSNPAGSDASAISGYDPSFWSCDKETVRLETAILEDLNKYCWSQQEQPSGTATTTDGHIYTLTVLNGVDQTPWFRPPLAAIIKEEDGSLSSPGSLEHMQQSTLDIDSILNIIPGPGGGQINGYASGTVAGNYATGTPSPNTDGLIKSETYTYDDSGYADNKDELASTIYIDTPMLEKHDSFNNNNNDWKLTNNNTSTNTSATSPSATTNSPSTPNALNTTSNPSATPTGADSLLRSALQGKAFIRYNGSSPKPKTDSHSELRRALSTPPALSDPKDTEDLQQHQMQQQQQAGGQSAAGQAAVQSGAQPALITGIDAGAILFVEAPSRLGAEDNPPSAHSMDDILLSHLDAASYPEDYEKLKRIANEVAESVQQYCQLEPMYGLSPSAADQSLLATQLVQATVSSSSKPQQAHSQPQTQAQQSRKYKRSNSAGAATTSKQSAQGATSTSNGVRKERSLHYCSICSKGFKDKYSVNVHIRTHTGEKPFACSLCGKSFRQKAHLAKHYQTHIAQKNAAVGGTAAAGGSAAGAAGAAGAASKPAKTR